MGNVLFGVDIAGIINDVISPGVLDVTVEVYTAGARTSGNLTGGRARTADTFTCKGFWDDFTGTPPPGVTIELNDRRANLIGDSIPAGRVVKRNDAITVHEEGGDFTLYAVKLLSRDPAAAMFQYLCRDRRGPDNA